MILHKFKSFNIALVIKQHKIVFKLLFFLFTFWVWVISNMCKQITWPSWTVQKWHLLMTPCKGREGAVSFVRKTLIFVWQRGGELKISRFAWSHLWIYPNIVSLPYIHPSIIHSLYKKIIQKKIFYIIFLFLINTSNP